jgi:hypothetical protein
MDEPSQKELNELSLYNKRKGKHNPKKHGFMKWNQNVNRISRRYNKAQFKNFDIEKEVNLMYIPGYSIKKGSWRSYIGRYYCSCCGPPGYSKKYYSVN